MERSRVLLAAAFCLTALSACTTNPATGKRIYTLGMTRDQEIKLGAEAAPEFTKEYGGKVENPALQQYVTGIGTRLAKETEAQNPSLPWEFTLLNTDTVNAFALPGGKVFFTRGLAEKLTSEAQMAGVLGHEIGHVTAQHAAQRIASATTLQGALAVGAAVVSTSSNSRVQQIGGYGIPAVTVGGQLVMLKFGRGEELEADRLGMRYMSNIGYNPRGQLEVMQVLQQLSQGSKQPEFLSTHPDPAARIQQVQQLLATQYASTQNNPNYQDFKERYKAQFLDVINKLPRPPKPQQQASAEPDAELGDPVHWCAFCRAAAAASGAKTPEPGPVPPREGIYAFFAPAAP
jgi:predicted Zn-dependent protease